MKFSEYVKEVRVGVIGFSNEDSIASQSQVEACLDQGMIDLGIIHGKVGVNIVSGLTNVGVPRIAYEYAKANKMKTVGISAKEADKYELFDVDETFIKGDKFGDESDFFLEYIDVLIKIGGGAQSIKEFKAFNGPKVEYDLNKGTYAGLRLSEESKEKLVDFIKDNGIINPTPKGDMHITLLYSRKHLPDYKPAGRISGKAKPKSFKVFETFDKKRALVLLLDSKYCLKRHEELMQEHGATFDYDEYSPHVTLSYDIGENKKPSQRKLDELPTELELVEEYIEDLNLEWKPKT